MVETINFDFFLILRYHISKYFLYELNDKKILKSILYYFFLSIDLRNRVRHKKIKIVKKFEIPGDLFFFKKIYLFKKQIII